MLKYKNFIAILLVFMFGAALLTGCAGEETGETVPDDESGLSDNHLQDTATAGGALKAVDTAAGTLTIATESDGDIVLEVTDESKIFIGGSLSNLEELADKIDSEAYVEYNSVAKTVTEVNIKE